MDFLVEKFTKTELEHKLDRDFGYRDRTIYEDIADTHLKYMFKYGTEDIKIICNDVPVQEYKIANRIISIIHN